MFAMDLEMGILNLTLYAVVPGTSPYLHDNGHTSRHLFRDMTKWLGNVFPTFSREDNLHTKQRILGNM